MAAEIFRRYVHYKRPNASFQSFGKKKYVRTTQGPLRRRNLQSENDLTMTLARQEPND